jgi:opacity protein-like surface antigen
MKKRYFLVSILTLIFSYAIVDAQETTTSLPDYDHKLEFTPLVGYMLSGSINFVQGDIRFKDNINYGLALSVGTGWGTFIEGIYTFSASEATYRSYYGFDSRKFDVGIHYMQIGGVKEFQEGRIRPFGSLSLGTSAFIPNDPFFESWWSFAVNLGAGVKIHITEHIGIRMQARLLMPLYLSGVGIFCGTGGCGSGLTASSNVIQGDFMGGLIIGF